MKTPFARVCPLAVVVLEFALMPLPAPGRNELAYVGTYTRSISRGIYAIALDDATGRLMNLGLAVASEDPSFLAWDATGTHLYAVNELPSARKTDGTVSAFARAPHDFHLRPLGQASTGGVAPCHLAVTAGGLVFAANYSSGSVAAIPILADGRLGERSYFDQLHGSGPDPKRQESPHAHCTVVDPTGRFLLACDLGTDRVMVYRLGDQTVPAQPAYFTVAPGSGPRHVAFSKAADRVYVLSEMKSTVSVFRWDPAEGHAALLQTASTLPPDWAGTSTAAEVVLGPDGRFLYASNRGHDSLAVFPILADGRLGPARTVPCGGHTPRSFAFDPTGRFLLCAGQDSDSIQAFRVDPATGLPAPVGAPLSMGKPVCILFAR